MSLFCYPDIGVLDLQTYQGSVIDFDAVVKNYNFAQKIVRIGIYSEVLSSRIWIQSDLNVAINKINIFLSSSDTRSLPAQEFRYQIEGFNTLNNNKDLLIIGKLTILQSIIQQ